MEPTKQPPDPGLAERLREVRFGLEKIKAAPLLSKAAMLEKTLGEAMDVLTDLAEAVDALRVNNG
jgi:hypothetical protein